MRCSPRSHPAPRRPTSFGGYLVGVAVAYFSSHPSLPPEWRLLIVTGFLGGLTTFSTFSGESLALMQKGDFTAAAIHSAVHLLGCLAAAAIGFRLMR